MMLKRKWRTHTCLASFLTGLLVLSACGVSVKPDTPSSFPPKFQASGSEPFWSMTWDGSSLKVFVGVEQDMSQFASLTSIENEKGWFLKNADLFEMNVLNGPCLDMAGESNDYEIDAILGDVRLVGCANAG